MTKTMTGYVDLDDGELYYEMADDGDTLVLGHAGFVDSRMWDAQWDAFTQKYRVIRFDMRGYGKSDPAAGPRTRRYDLFQLLDHLQVERAALLGCSLGGQVMINFVLEHPEMTSAIGRECCLLMLSARLASRSSQANEQTPGDDRFQTCGHACFQRILAGVSLSDQFLRR